MDIAARKWLAEGYRVLEDAIAARAFPGCAFGILAGGDMVLQDALGQFTYEQDSPTVTAQTVYDIASLTKVVATTTMAMQLYQRGVLELNTRISEILPKFVAGRANNDPAQLIEVRHLLAHNSGLPGYVEFFRTAKNSTELLNACMQLQIKTLPGTHEEYSDPGFILLGKTLETMANEPITDLAQQEIFQPLKLDATRFCPLKDARPLIPPTEVDTKLRHRIIQGEVQDENASVLNGIAGHAGVFSNVPDLLRFAREILVAQVNGSLLYTPATIKLFATRQAPEGSSRALGWDTPSANSSSGHYFSPHSIGHLGYSGCSLWIDLEDEIAIVLLTNRTWPDRGCQKIKQIRPAFHDAVRKALRESKPYTSNL